MKTKWIRDFRIGRDCYALVMLDVDGEIQFGSIPYYDTEHDVLISEDTLRNEYNALEDRPDTFGEWLCQCMTYNGGTLEEVRA